MYCCGQNIRFLSILLLILFPDLGERANISQTPDMSCCRNHNASRTTSWSNHARPQKPPLVSRLDTGAARPLPMAAKFDAACVANGRQRAQQRPMDFDFDAHSMQPNIYILSE